MTEEKTRPWLTGIVDTLVGAALIRVSTIPHRNRLAVILIDSAFETACRAFLLHTKRMKLDEAHRHREPLVKTMKSVLKDVDSSVWDSIDFYYTEIRNDFYHQSAGKTITDVAVLDYLDTVEFVIDRCFDIHVSQLVSTELPRVLAPADAQGHVDRDSARLLRSAKSKAEKLIVAVSFLNPKTAESVNEFFRREGEPTRLKPDDFTNIVARNSGSKKFFYFNRETKAWELSGLGRFKLSQFGGEV
jgi:hypothetical protein